MTNNSGICEKQTQTPDARYSSSNPFANLGNSYNYSIAFAKKWENADIVLGYARKKQGNYFVGKHGSIPEVESIDYKREDYIEMGDEYDSIIEGSTNFKNKQGYTYYRAGEEVLNTSQDNKSYLAKLNLYNDNHRINFTYRGYRSKFGELMPSIMVRGYGSLEGEGSEVEVDSYSTKYTYSPQNPYIHLNISAYLTKSDSSNFTPLSQEYGYDFGSDGDSRHAHFTLSTQKGVSVDNTSKFKVLNRDLKLNYGISYAIERIKPPKDALDRVRAKGYPEDAIAPLYIRNAKKREFSAFVSANYKLTKELTFDTGLRYINSKITDYQPLEKFKGYEQDPITGKWVSIIERSYNNPNKAHAISPIVMLSYEPILGYQFYIKYAQAVRSASLFQASKGWSQQNADNSMADLKPERQRNWEIGTNLLFDDVLYDDSILGLKFAFFNNYTKDYLTRTNTIDNSGAIVMQTMNIDSALYRGFEASAYYDMGVFYTKLGLTKYIKTEFCNTEKGGKVCYKGGIINSNIANTLPPKTTFNATIGTRLFNNKLDLGARYSYYGKRIVSVFSHDEKGGNTKSEEWKPYNLVDIYANYKVNDNFTISATLDNVTNRYYLDANNMGLTPAPGRTLHINFDYKF
ncbi:TonB-dependent receptor domain-containing protein [Campylobacter blaseri]|uniref:TonB-dependent receptor domain-containing protein n=1 Tax=Campylobacter blaseri TaxID=2042961 RepID=UPI0019D4BC71|nr:TonB-dependent receptor [Campylobacter blaseri]